MRREESPTKAFTEAEDALSKQLENQPKCEAEKPKLKSQIPKHKRWLYSVWYLEFGAWDFYVFSFKRSIESPAKATTKKTAGIF